MNKCIPEDVLNKNSIKNTKQRIEVLQCIIDLCEPFNTRDLYLKTRDNIDIDQVTVYRILKIFLKKELIREVVNISDGHFFELSCVHNPSHPHFICTKCNKIICLKKYDYTKMNHYKNNNDDFRIDSVSIIFRGICKNCMKEK